MKKKFFISLVLGLSLCLAAGAQTYKVAIVQVSTSESFKQLVLAIGEVMKVNFEVQIVPGTRAAYLVENKQVDIGMPVLGMRDPAKVAALGYDYATSSIYRNSFVLYTNKAKAVDIAELKKGNAKGYKIETGGSNVNQYEFPALPSTNAEASLKKVDAGSIDGYLYSQITADAALKATGLKTIRRQTYDDYDLVFMLQKGARGGALDKLITAGLAKLKADGRFDKIMGDIIKSARYVEWQP
jgi:polar amino acid transport system substrate-binding protein